MYNIITGGVPVTARKVYYFSNLRSVHDRLFGADCLLGIFVHVHNVVYRFSEKKLSFFDWVGALVLFFFCSKQINANEVLSLLFQTNVKRLVITKLFFSIFLNEFNV